MGSYSGACAAGVPRANPHPSTGPHGPREETTMPERPIVHCTRATPWNAATHIPGTQVIHEATQTVGEPRDGYPGGDLITVECQSCHHRWEQELPQ